ncbi:glycosyl hydrolase family 61-domain-containing protein [Mucidula mucida]|nr:glycosyl hydrolase family 61-domain-containing protein [Mucidula mucida]
MLSAALSSVHAHGNVQSLTIDGTVWSGYLPYEDPYKSPVPDRIMRSIPGNGPIEDVTSSDIQCNAGTSPAALVASAAAGSQIAFNWTAWPDSHKGPVVTYMAEAPTDITAYEPGTDAVWFKIDEAGYEDGKWAATDILTGEQNSIWTVTIPAGLKAGQYLVRHELIALHSAGTYPGAQFYPSCTQIEVTGSGTASPDSSFLVSFPGAYAGSDPGITFNLYTTFDSYTIPGPAVWTGDGSTGGASSSTAAAVVSSTGNAVTTTAVPTSAAEFPASSSVESSPVVTTSAAAAPSSSAVDDDDDTCDIIITTSAASSAPTTVPASTTPAATSPATGTTSTSAASPATTSATSGGSTDCNTCMNSS